MRLGDRIRYLLLPSILFETGHFLSPTDPTLAELELPRALPSLLRLQACKMTQGFTCSLGIQTWVTTIM